MDTKNAGDNTLASLARAAASCRIVRSKRCRPFRSISGDRRTVSACSRQLAALQGKVAIPAAEAILENHYTVNKAQSSLSHVSRDMRRERFTMLCRSRGIFTIRALAVCEDMLTFTDYCLDYAALSEYVNAFQEISPLDESEIAMLPLCIRILCVKKCADIYERACRSARDRYRAAELYESVTATQSETARDRLLQKCADTLGDSGICYLTTLFADNDDFAYIDKLKRLPGLHSTDIRAFAARDAEEGRTVSRLAVNIASTLRFCASLDTDKLLHDFSEIEKILRRDDTYNSLDEPSRRAYSDACAYVARKMHVSQSYAAKAAFDSGDVNYYLGNRDGIRELMALLGKKKKRMSSGRKVFLHVAIQLFFTIIISLMCMKSGVVPGILSLFPAYMLVNSIFLQIISRIVRPVPVHRMKIEKEAPEKTVTAISVLLTDEKTLEDAVEKIETHYLSANLANTYYAILGDFPDSKDADETDEEKKLARTGAEMTRRLNRKYGDVFCFLLRKRSYNKNDNIYMGYERKRGAVMQFFNLVKNDAGRSDYSVTEGTLPRDIKYALLLDSDTYLPKNALAKLIGCAVYPQNRAVVKGGKIVQGYGIFIPRMERLARSTTGFMQTRNGAGGVSPYSSVVCDFYHDNYGEAIFGGKGLVDIAAFMECMHGKIKDSTVLSHDMLESSFVRSAYVSDVILYDTEPATLISWWKRAHRWIRGDWQLLPYLFEKKGSPMYVSALTKWKIADNLRRSLTPVAILQAMLILPYFGMGLYVWLALACAFYDALSETYTAVKYWIMHGSMRLRSVGLAWERCLVDFMSLPYAAARVIDAVWRTLHRLLVSHKKMLQWQTAAQSEKVMREKAILYYMELWACFWTGLRLLILPLFGLSGSLILGILFVYAPFALRMYDAPLSKPALCDETLTYFREIARDIWRFFEEYAREEQGFIPPDNVQEYPYKPPVEIASPTNIGMGIAAALCAYELGFTDADALTHRLSVTQDYIESLEKWNGHLYNWYNIAKRQRLTPSYVSTVDSGNLCACMYAATAYLTRIGTEKATDTADRMYRTIADTDFSVLYDGEKNLFYIGYDVSRCALTDARYDLLASEARLTYLVAIAFDKIPYKSWKALGRALVRTQDGRSLCSWSGTMFEYLMPCIFTGLTPYTLMDESAGAAVDEHIACSGGRMWGISESGYYAFDRNMYYQYKAFGAPRLGLSPMYSYEDVRAPYASCLAALIYPEKSADNLRAFEKAGVRGAYGFYEAVDYTKERVQTGREFEVVRSYMAHHQGMSICALTEVLSDNALSKSFMSLAHMRTVSILNDEKRPDDALTLQSVERVIIKDEDVKRKYSPPVYTEPGRYPAGTFLTNGRLTAMFSDGGLSYIRLCNTYITRCRRDGIRGAYGLYLYLNDGDNIYCINTSDAGNAAPVRFTFDCYRALAETDTDDIGIRTETVVCQSSDTLCIKITVANKRGSVREFDAGAFAELAIAQLSDDTAHPAFVNLTTDAERTDDGVVYRRRHTHTRRDMYVCAAFSGGGSLRVCADAESIGRFRSYRDAMADSVFTDKRIKSPINPVLAMRNTFTVGAGESAQLTLCISAGENREQVINSARSAAQADFSELRSLSFAMEMSALGFMGIPEGKAHVFSRAAVRLASGTGHFTHLAREPKLRKDALYRFSLSGDLPIVTAEITGPVQYRMLKTLLSFLRFCAYKGEIFDLVIIGRYDMSYRSDVKSYIDGTAATFMLNSQYGESEHVHIIDGYNISDEEYDTLLALTDMYVDTSRSFDKQFGVMPFIASNIPKTDCEKGEYVCSGEISDDGEYTLLLSRDADTPLPYSNIVCNPQNEAFGTLTTESGGGYTWSGNCREGRLTPWHCDPMHDVGGEILLITDNENNARTVYHSRMQGGGTVTVRYGMGYTVYENPDALCSARMTVFTDTDFAQKITLLELENTGNTAKKLTLRYMLDKSCTGYTSFRNSVAYIRDPRADGITYMYVKNADSVRFSGDREGELLFYPRTDDVNSTAFVCLYADVTLYSHEKRTVLLMAGCGADAAYAERAISGINVQSAQEKLCRIRRAWDDKLSALTVATPDRNFNIMVNSRLLYQVYASRLYSRTGYYQSGGAIGFRDQLQDVLCLLYTDPDRAKGQIILCASMQYEAGDCMHWWHTNRRGVRTRISDDRLFLPYVCAQYVSVTGDTALPDMRVPYLDDEPIPDGADDKYYEAKVSKRDGTIYEHCMRAIRASCIYGAHGLPLMGAGDWNDGMNKVGDGGGESVFLAFMLIVTIEKFLPLCASRRDTESITFLRGNLKKLRDATDAYAWDGAWFRRAYYGDGTPLGSKENAECMIDLLTQCWGVFAEHGSAPEKCAAALKSVRELLENEKNGTIALLTPPFSDNSEHYAGYVESYAGGVRENGAQYTHAAVWYLIAACMILPDKDVMRIWHMLCPMEKDTATYKAEPFCMCADVYTCEGAEGRGGWSWYTGSAGWMYTAAVRYVIGMEKRGDTLIFTPHNTWDGYAVTYRYGNSTYHITVIRSDGKKNNVVKLCDDGGVHEVTVTV